MSIQLQESEELIVGIVYYFSIMLKDMKQRYVSTINRARPTDSLLLNLACGLAPHPQFPSRIIRLGLRSHFSIPFPPPGLTCDFTFYNLLLVTVITLLLAMHLFFEMLCRSFHFLWLCSLLDCGVPNIVNL